MNASQRERKQEKRIEIEIERIKARKRKWNWDWENESKKERMTLRLEEWMQERKNEIEIKRYKIERMAAVNSECWFLNRKRLKYDDSHTQKKWNRKRERKVKGRKRTLLDVWLQFISWRKQENAGGQNFTIGWNGGREGER